jgi:Fe-S-cluster containining protein
MLPAVYERIMPEFFERSVPEETRATCESCAMCKKADGAAPDGMFFRPDVKCCSYHPKLPGYLVGATLAEGGEGALRIEAKIAARVGVTPQWISAPQKFLVLYDAARHSSFGRSTALLCPYFENGRCSIWKNRESVCTTFFCKYEKGAVGRAFWVAVRQYLGAMERALAEYAVKVVAPELVEPQIQRLTLSIDDLEDRPPSDDSYSAYWGAWKGREKELYAASFRVISELSRDDYERVVHNARGRELFVDINAHYDEVVEPKLRERLVLNPTLTKMHFDNGMAVTTYSTYDTLFLADPLYSVLEKLRAEETLKEGLARLDRDEDIQIEESLLLMLQLHQILVPPA